MPCLGMDTGVSFRWMELFQGADRVVMGRDWGGGKSRHLPLRRNCRVSLASIARTRQLGKVFQGWLNDL